MKILFMCVANSARSQMAEGLGRSILGGEHEIQSAGSNPAHVNPFAIQAMTEIGIDISNHRSKTVNDLPLPFLASIDLVIALCAEEVCPVIPLLARKLHWPFIDPAGTSGTDEHQLLRFREVRDKIKQKIEQLAKELT